MVSANESPRGISSERKRPITSPWLSVLTSSPGSRDRCAGGGRLEREAREPLERRNDDRRLREERGPGGSVACGAYVEAAAQRPRRGGPTDEWLRSEHDELPVVEPGELARQRA